MFRRRRASLMGVAFPFKSYRKGQKEAIEAARKAFARGKRFVIIEAPTGSGKSVMAVSLAEDAASAFILTAQKLLQEQYLRDFPHLALMKGRANYPCLIAPTHAAAAPCITGKKLPECDACPYFCAKDTAIAADNALMNYAYYLAELNFQGGFGPRELLVLDEAHNAEGALMGFIEVVLADTELVRAGIAEGIPSALDELGYFDYAEDLMPLLRARSRELEGQMKSGQYGPGAGLELLAQKQYLDNLYGRLETLIYSLDEENVEWVVERQRSGRQQRITFKPVTVASFAEDKLFGYAERVLMLSATILDPPTYLRGLGIEPSEAEIIRVSSEFPPENRPIYVKPVARLTRHYLEKDLPKLVAAIAELLSSHRHDKGIIHTHTYKIAAYIAQNLPSDLRKRIVTHSSAEGRDAALEQHVQSKKPTVLLSPSMTEGLDLPGDLSRWQVICKLPYPYLGDPQIAKRRELDPSWYDWRTCLSVVQAYGRSVRSADDYAVTYVLDADFAKFVRRQAQRLPAWFLEAVQG